MSTLPTYASSSSAFEPSSSSSRLRPPSQSYFNPESDDDDVFDPQSIDPELRLRTVRTAHSVIAESIRTEEHAEKRAKRRRLFRNMTRKASGLGLGSLKESIRRKAPSEAGTADSRRATVTTLGVGSESGSSPQAPHSPQLPTIVPPSPVVPPQEEVASWKPFGQGKGKGKAEPERRSVFVNIPLPHRLLDSSGEPIVRYVRNKVRTSKYTLITFLPKNLFEQFRRVANIYFLFGVIIQFFPAFGAPNAQIGMLPLVAILGITAIKDGIEDWRRVKLDSEVNNSATTKLEGWRNVNQPKDPRSVVEKVFGIGQAPGRTSKGVRKLRAQEGNLGNQIVMDSQKSQEEELDNVVVVDKESYPLENMPSLEVPSQSGYRHSLMLRKTTSAPSMVSRKSVGVMDWSRPGMGSAQWERTLWKKLEVGDIVLLRDNDQVPADIIVLSTSNADDLCFVETKNLDGETNLKIRRALKATASISSEEDLEHARFVVDSEGPHANLYTYNGVLKYTPADPYGKGEEERADAITINELLLRGCSLRNTKWVIGMVVFTGGDTKIMMNGGETPSKRSKIEKETNL
ncbi:hypothetical protein CI109_102996 [Kwoniella shandongensis]|uniref:Uncharacterized protein n=1 Tax=Kwoniella shandongensis TaxID=1734106 RepID=A0A5M6CBZ0_9TREE|nr:uncharacterized protein CI109_000183 [Kwoniella shandongensis]KAA5531342.1 hypothetical protein CI109_000183 [Kwoniella shandongensis]